MMFLKRRKTTAAKFLKNKIEFFLQKVPLFELENRSDRRINKGGLKF